MFSVKYVIDWPCIILEASKKHSNVSLLTYKTRFLRPIVYHSLLFLHANKVVLHTIHFVTFRFFFFYFVAVLFFVDNVYCHTVNMSVKILCVSDYSRVAHMGSRAKQLLMFVSQCCTFLQLQYSHKIISIYLSFLMWNGLPLICLIILGW